MQPTRRRSATGPHWLFAFALLLRAAMPFLANASAEAQGLAIGEVCSVYGVSAAGRHQDDAPGAPGAGHGDHCVLNALAALGTSTAPPRLGSRPPSAHAGVPPVATPSGRRDATRAWFARRKQGPPRLA